MAPTGHNQLWADEFQGEGAWLDLQGTYHQDLPSGSFHKDLV